MTGASVLVCFGRASGRFRGCRDCDSAFAESQSAEKNSEVEG